MKERSKEAYWKKFIGGITVRLAQNPKNSTVESCRGALSERALPRTRQLFPLCITSLSVTAPGLPVLRGVSGGGAALSSLCRRFPGGDIMNLISRRSPLSGLSFSLFFFLRERKRGLRRRRSREISDGKTKPDSEPSPLRGRLMRKNTGRINFSPCVNRIQFLLSELTGRPDIILSASRMSFSTLSRRV